MTESADSTVEYGIRAPGGTAILMTTEDLMEAEVILGSIGHGDLMQRTVRYGAWRQVDDIQTAVRRSQRAAARHPV